LVTFKTTASSFNKGIVVKAMRGIILSESVSSRAGETVMSTGTGTFTVQSTKTLCTTNQVFSLTADDMDIIGDISSGTTETIITCHSPAQTVAIGTAVRQFTLSGAELQHFTMVGLTIGSTPSVPVCGTLDVSAITEAQSNSVTGVVSLMAYRSGHQVKFIGSGSTFNTLVAQADNGITLLTNVRADVGSVLMNGDVDASYLNDGRDDVRLGHFVSLVSKEHTELNAVSGYIHVDGHTTIMAGSGILLNDHVQGNFGALTLLADYESHGDGEFTVIAGKHMDQRVGDITITAWDVDLQGSADAGLYDIIIHGAKADQTIGVGNTTKHMHISQDELERMTTGTRLVIGSSYTGYISVDGVTDNCTDAIQTMTLVATQPARYLEFVGGPSSFNKGIVVQAGAGVILSQSLTTKSTGTTLRGTTGTLTLSTSQSISTTGQTLVLTADDFDIQGDSISTGTASVVITTESNLAIGLGTTLQETDIEAEELEVIESGGLIVGSAGVNNNVNIVGIKARHSNGITGLVTLVATQDDAQVVFQSKGSTFWGVHAQADNGIVSSVDATATSGSLLFDGDFEHEYVGDTTNTITSLSGRTYKAATMMTLQAKTGWISPLGTLTLSAGAGIVLHDNILGTSGAITINSDSDSDGEGILTVESEKRVYTADSMLTITVSDLVLDGLFNTGTAQQSWLASTTNTFGLGSVPAAMLGSGISVTGTEVARTTADGVVIGSGITGSVSIIGITAVDSNTISGIISVIGTRDDAQMTFATTASTFNALSVQADDGVLVQVDLTCDTATMTLEGDTDDSVDTHDKVALSSGRVLTSKLEMTLDATTGGIIRSGSAVMSLRSDKGIIISDDLSGTVQGVALHINADANASGQGGLTIMAAKAVTSNNGLLSITAADLQIQGSLTSGTVGTKIHTASNKNSIGLGATTQDMRIEGPELQRITSKGITIGKLGVNRSIKLAGISEANSNHLTELITLLATVDDSQVLFTSSGSTFSTLYVAADDGVELDAGVFTSIGNMYLDGDYEDEADGRNTVQLGSDKMVASTLLLTLEASTGFVTTLGPATFRAGSGIMILDNLTAKSDNKLMTFNADFDSHGDGTLTLWNSKTITTANGDLAITAWDVDLPGSIDSGIASISVHGAKVSQTFGLGATAQHMQLTDAEIGRLTGTGGLTIGTSTSGSLTVDGIYDSSSDTIATLTLRATKHARLVTFVNGPSSFNKGIIVQGMGGIVLSESVTTQGNGVRLVAGTGTVTVLNTKTLSTTNQLLSITADDMDINGAVSSGTAEIYILPTTASHTIGIGATSKDMHMSDAELGFMSTVPMLTIGDSSNGSIFIDGVTDGSSDDLGVLRLRTTKAKRNVQFIANPSSFNKGLEIFASDGVILSQSVTVTNSDTKISAGTGTMTVAATRSLSTTNQLLTITADDVDILGTVNTGTHYVTIECGMEGRTAGFGSTAQQFIMDGEELQFFTAAGLSFGGANCADVTMQGITKDNSAGIADIVSILAHRDNTTVTFSTTASTFGSLVVQADSGIAIDADVTTTSGSMNLDGDFDDSAAGHDVPNTIRFATARLVQSHKLLTLEATAGTLVPSGTLTLEAGSGVVVLDNMTSASVGNAIVFNADFESQGDGTLTVVGTKTITTNNGNLLITAWDVDMAGSVTVGTASLSVHGAKVTQTFGLGSTNQDMHITDAEVGRLSTNGGLAVGSSLTGSLSVDGVTDGNSDAIATLTLIATKANQLITFTATASEFNKGIIVQAMKGIILSESVTTKSDAVLMRTGTGTLTVQATKSLSTSGQMLTITSDDFDVPGTVNSGNATLTTASFTSVSMGVGTTSAVQYKMVSAELQRMSYTGLTIGAYGVNSGVRVEDIDIVNRGISTGLTTIIATVDDSMIKFQTTASTFYALAAQADAGIDVDINLWTTTGSMYLDADYDDAGDPGNSIQFANGKSVTAFSELTLEATSGLLVRAGTLTMEAGSGIVVLNDLTSSATSNPLVINADFESTGDGTLTLAAGKAISTDHGHLLLTAWDVDMAGSVEAETGSISIHGAHASQTFGMGATSHNMHLSDSEIGRLSALGGFTVGSSLSGSFEVDGMTNASTDAIATLTLIATKSTKTITFDSGHSSFNKGIILDAMGGVILSASMNTVASGLVVKAGTGR
jgi:hypothetical protein